MLIRALALAALLSPTFGQCLEHSRLVAPDAEIGDDFGAGVAADGDVVVFGAPEHDEGAGHYSGAAYVYRHDSTTGAWSFEQELVGSVLNDTDLFGRRLAVEGGWLAVAAVLGDGSVTLSGAVYVFRYDAAQGVWLETQRLSAPDARALQYFGLDVDLSGEAMVVRARGSAYVFRYDAGSDQWLFEEKLVPSLADDTLWATAAIDGDLAVLGAPYESAPPAYHSGSVVVFERDPATGSWSEDHALLCPLGIWATEFGQDVSVAGATVAVSFRKSLVPEVRGGGVYLFERNAAGRWGPVERVGSSLPFEAARFGAAIDLNDDGLLVGADLGDAAFLYDRDAGGTLTLRCKLVASDDGPGLVYFGSGVALSDAWAAVGAPTADAPPILAGVGYVFER